MYTHKTREGSVFRAALELGSAASRRGSLHLAAGLDRECLLVTRDISLNQQFSLPGDDPESYQYRPASCQLVGGMGFT